MARIVWRVWGISAAVAGGLIAADKPADLPVRSEVNGRSTPAITQDHHQPETAPAPRVLPNRVLNLTPSKTDPMVRLAALSEDRGTAGWKARATLEVAELHFRSCDAEEARKWYREVIKLAPGSEYAEFANERLDQTNILPAGATESREPPLAEATGHIKELQIRVLWEAARQYKAAVDSGDRDEIGKCSRGLEAALKYTRPAEPPGSIP
jgi:hypothetical protein